MPGVLTNVVKGSMLGRVDTRLKKRANELSSDYRARLEELRGWFVNGMSHVDHAKKMSANGNDQRVATNPQHEAHARDEFFGDDAAKCFFPDMPGDSEDEIVRGAYIRAIDLALGQDPQQEPKPIVSYWIINGRDGKDSDAFEIFVSETPREVHVLMLTPMPAHVPPPGPQGYAEAMFVVSTNARVQEIEDALPQNYPKNHVALPGTNGVDCMQVIGW